MEFPIMSIRTAPHPPAGTFSPQAGRRGLADTVPPLSSPRARGEDAGRQVRGSANLSKVRP